MKLLEKVFLVELYRKNSNKVFLLVKLFFTKEKVRGKV